MPGSVALPQAGWGVQPAGQRVRMPQGAGVGSAVTASQLGQATLVVKAVVRLLSWARVGVGVAEPVV